MFDIDRMITMADDCEEAIGLLQKRDKSTDQMYNLPKKHREIKEGEIYLSIAEAGRDMMKNLADGSEDAVSTESGQMEKSKYIVPVIRKTRSFDVANLDIASLYKRQAINEDMEKPVKSVTAETAVEEGVTFLDQVFSKESRFFEEKSSTDTSKSDKKVKRGGGIMNNLGMTLSEKDDKVSALMAELMKSKERLALVNKQLYVYDQENGCFELCCKDVAAMRIRSLIPKELRNRISFSEYKQAYQLLTISEEIAKKTISLRTTLIMSTVRTVFTMPCGVHSIRIPTNIVSPTVWKPTMIPRQTVLAG